MNNIYINTWGSIVIRKMNAKYGVTLTLTKCFTIAGQNQPGDLVLKFGPFQDLEDTNGPRDVLISSNQLSYGIL